MNPEPSDNRLSRRTEALILGLLTLAGLAVRLLFLGRAQLWGDEILFVVRDAHPVIPVREIYGHMLEGFSSVTHLPFPLMAHNLLIRALMSLFLGNNLSPFWFRFPSVLWGTAAVPAMFRLVRNRLPRPTAWLATAWMALGFFPVAYSREAYFYAPLLTLGLVTLHFWLCGIESISGGKRLTLGAVAGILAAGTAMVHSHVTGILLQAVLTGAALVAVCWAWRRPGSSPSGAVELTVISAVPLLLVSPFLRVWWVERIQSAMDPGTPVWLMVWDVAGKCFLGNLIVPNALGLFILLWGFAGLVRAGTRECPAPRWMAGLGAVLFLLLAVAARHTAYHARYFVVLLPVLLAANACGLSRLARAAGRLRAFRTIRPLPRLGLAGGAVLFLNLLIVSLFWWPTVRARDYAAVAEWLNRNLPPGGAYLWESAYERRFVSEKPDAPFPTPHRLFLWPMVHVGSREIPEMHRLQRDLLERYPDVPWIDCRHGQRKGMEFGDWEWPRTYFRRLALIQNRSFLYQERFRVALYPLGRFPVSETSVPVRFNTPSDVMAMDIEAGRSGTLFYPGWAFDVFAADETAQEYGRFHPGAEAPILAVSLQDGGGGAVLEAGVAVGTRRRGDVRLDLVRGGDVLGSWTVPAGRRFRSVRSPAFPLSEGQDTLVLRADAGPSNEVRAIWLERARLESPRTASAGPE